MYHCLSIFTIITQTKTRYNCWMFQTHFIWVMSTSLHLAKWSSIHHTAQNVSQSTKLEENHVNGKTQNTFTVIYTNSVQWYNQRSSLCSKHAGNVVLFKPVTSVHLESRMTRSLSFPGNHLRTPISVAWLWIRPIPIHSYHLDLFCF